MQNYRFKGLMFYSSILHIKYILNVQKRSSFIRVDRSLVNNFQVHVPSFLY